MGTHIIDALCTGTWRCIHTGSHGNQHKYTENTLVSSFYVPCMSYFHHLSFDLCIRFEGKVGVPRREGGKEGGREKKKEREREGERERERDKD